MKLRPLPTPGELPQDWYAYIVELDRYVRKLGISNMSDVDLTTPPSNGEVLVFDSADGKWKSGAN